MTPTEVQRLAERAAFPNGVGEWRVRAVVPFVTRLAGERWRYVYGAEKVARARSRPCQNSREGWAVLYALPEEIDGKLVEFFPSMQWVRIYSDGAIEIDK